MEKTRNQQPSRMETRLSVRIKPDQKALLARAARLRYQTLTEFVLANALQVATELVRRRRISR